MRIVMNETRDGSPDGIEVRTYQAGQEYEVPADLGSVFLVQGWGREPSISAPETEPGGRLRRTKG